MCVETEYFPIYLKRQTRAGDPPAPLLLADSETSQTVWPSTNVKGQMFPYGLCTYSRASPDSPSPVPFNYRQCKRVQNKLLFFFQPVCIKQSVSPRTANMVPLPSGPEIGGLDDAPGPGPFLASIWLSKSFLSEKLLFVKVFV